MVWYEFAVFGQAASTNNYTVASQTTMFRSCCTQSCGMIIPQFMMKLSRCSGHSFTRSKASAITISGVAFACPEFHASTSAMKMARNSKLQRSSNSCNACNPRQESGVSPAKSLHGPHLPHRSLQGQRRRQGPGCSVGCCAAPVVCARGPRTRPFCRVAAGRCCPGPRSRLPLAAQVCRSE